MALLGRRTAIVPLGISCQTAHQIERAQGFLAELCDDVFVPETTPFDWRIVGPKDLAGMLAENNPYPASADELVGTKRPYWPKRRCHFWHDGAGNFANFTAKQAHLWANWGRIAHAERKIFVLSNTQANLPRKARDPGGFDYRLYADELVMLATVLGAQFKRPELHVVSQRALIPDLERLPELARGLKGVRLGLHLIKTAVGGWHGDDDAWNGAFTAMMPT